MNITQKTIERFLNALSKPFGENECWIFTGSLTPCGYGSFFVDQKHRGVGAHQFSYIIHKGPLNPSLEICHSRDCMSKACCNPQHLRQDTHKSNMGDLIALGKFPFLPPMKGEKNPLAKIKDADAQEILRLLARGTSQVRIAAMYGINQSNVSRIKSGEQWRHIRDRA